MSEKDTIRTLQLIDTTLLKCYIKVGEDEGGVGGGATRRLTSR